jgi:hypothetical protein
MGTGARSYQTISQKQDSEFPNHMLNLQNRDRPKVIAPRSIRLHQIPEFI